jgi:hypothetical protein
MQETALFMYEKYLKLKKKNYTYSGTESAMS